jgi:peptide/nickel transport system ATP-binding protein
VTDLSGPAGATPRATGDGGPVLEVSHLSIDFGVDRKWVPAVVDLSYTVGAGEVLAIVGESGSGKSVSSLAVLGLLPRNARVTGSVRLRGTELIGARSSALREVRGDQVAMIFQEPMTALNPVYTIGFQIIEAIRLHTAQSPAQAKERALELLSLVELPDPERAFRSYPHQLSGGQRQRAMIAQSLALNPALLIADEPTTALDVTVQAEILDLMRNLRDKLDSAVILITHDMGVVADLSDRIIVMRHGKVVEQGSAQEIFYHPREPYTRELLAAVPHLGQAVAGDEIDVTVALAAAAGTTDLIADPAADRAEVDDRAALVREAAPAQVSTPPVVELSGVAIEYPRQGRVPAFRAVEGIDLVVHAGEVVGLVGESGSGKTTIGRATVGLMPIKEGSLRVAGLDLSHADRKALHALHHKVGMVFQDPSSSLNPRLPVGESIAEPLRLTKVAKGVELDRLVEGLLDRVHLPRSYRNRYPHELSGGQKQRIGIARALALSPDVLVADEPTSALDVSVQARVLELFKELQSTLRFATLFITHDLAVVDALADRIVVLQNGHVVEQGTRDEILRAPREPYTQRLIAAVPLPDPERQAARRALRSALVKAS